jgi:hypothetical protein
MKENTMDRLFGIGTSIVNLAGANICESAEKLVEVSDIYESRIMYMIASTIMRIGEALMCM